MSFRPPQSLRQPFSVESGFNVVEYELMAERANSLGRQVDNARESLLNEASDAVWALFVQREICGLRNSRDVIQRYGIPDEVLARLGSTRR
jgi:hypothetical protein